MALMDPAASFVRINYINFIGIQKIKRTCGVSRYHLFQE
jgi:hypothetical protein